MDNVAPEQELMVTVWLVANIVAMFAAIGGIAFTVSTILTAIFAGPSRVLYVLGAFAICMCCTSVGCLCVVVRLIFMAHRETAAVRSGYEDGL